MKNNYSHVKSNRDLGYRIFIYILGLGLIVIVGANCHNNSNNIVGSKNRESVNSDCQEFALQSIVEGIINFGGIQFDPNVFVGDLHGDSLSIEKLMSQKQLFMYISENMCSRCVETQLNNIKSFPKKGQITIIAAFNSKRMLKVMAKEREINIPIYHLLYRNVPSQMNDLSSPIYFFIGNDFEIENPFLTVDNLNSLTLMYLNKYLFE